jgi:hypothetical protein
VTLRPADPFDLIRWLARSQGDPRKAVAEFVQNSLDAGATKVDVVRRRMQGSVSLVVHDDGEGVLPDLEREAALRYIASHIGHSRKLSLTPVERRERVVAGKYGVGLLGFWSIGTRFELRSRVRGSKLLALRLFEDKEGGEIARLPLRTDAADTFTEVVVLDMHQTALRALGGARLASYLGSELRGQLLQRQVTLTVHDGIARGLAQKEWIVRPRRFLGERLDVPAEMAVEGFAPLRVELHLARGDEEAAVQIACAGTVVADNVSDLVTLGLGEAPWVGRSLVGVLDFPDFNIPPGTRRGVLPDAAAAAFCDAVERLRPLVETELARLEEARAAEVRRDVARDLRKALRGLAHRLPQYDLPRLDRIAQRSDADTNADAPGAPIAEVSPESIADSEPQEPELFPPGPLASLGLASDPVEVPAGGERRVRVEAHDTDGRPIRRKLELSCRVDGDGFAVHASGRTMTIRALLELPGATARLNVSATDGGSTAALEVGLIAVEARDKDLAAAGVPEPEFVSDAGGAWRSRWLGTRWQVNDAHEDYVALRGESRARLRYLLWLFTKEVVERSFGVPGSGDVLERMIEVLAHAERNLRGG